MLGQGSRYEEAYNCRNTKTLMNSYHSYVGWSHKSMTVQNDLNDLTRCLKPLNLKIKGSTCVNKQFSLIINPKRFGIFPWPTFMNKRPQAHSRRFFGTNACFDQYHRFKQTALFHELLSFTTRWPCFWR